MKPIPLKWAMLAMAVQLPGTAAAAQELDPTNIIEGMGERIPAGKENVSLSPLFKAYVFEKAGLKFVQINSRQDEVLSIVSVTPGAQSELPIGLAAKGPKVASEEKASLRDARTREAASCPCSAKVVHRDATVSTVEIHGASDEYITSYLIPSH